jgi:TadE-like protein
VAVEFLLAFPIAFLFFLAVAEFGLLLTNMRHVELAAFEGAREAAGLDERQLDEGVSIARRRADRTLQTAGTGRSCLVMIEHNVPGAGQERQISADRGCRIPGGRCCPLPDVERVYAIRCTVAVPMRHLAPDLLACVGLSLKHRKAYATVTVPYVGSGRHGTRRNDKDSKHNRRGRHGKDGGKPHRD